MRHDALVSLPALPRDEVEQWPLFLLAAEEQVEELIDKGIVRRQGIARQDHSGDSLEQPALKSRACALHHQPAEPMRKATRKFQGQDTPERDAHHCGPLQTMPFQKLAQILD